MKRILIFLLAMMPVAFCLTTAQAKPNKQKVVLSVDLHCQDCCDKILKNIPFDKDLKNGVKDIIFDLEAKTATVTYDANKTDVPAIQKSFAKIGKPATTLSSKSCNGQKCTGEQKCTKDQKCCAEQKCTKDQKCCAEQKCTKDQKCCAEQKCNKEQKCTTEQKCDGHHHAEGEHHHHH